MKLPHGYTAEQCERDMRLRTKGERGCANPKEHRMLLDDGFWWAMFGAALMLFGIIVGLAVAALS